ncbi:MAG: hypothetical protein JJE52_09310 [Acidimicrobiia bacterium]|nr:hypothetical protein [Acidimicrobiia bacterium]
MTDSVVYFLLVFDIKKNVLESHLQFEDVDEALESYAQAEQEHLGRGYEVVLVGAESLETVMVTHGAYFQRQVAAPRAGLSFSLS